MSPARTVLVAALAAVAAAGWWVAPFGSALRVHEDLPAEFAGKRNPLAGAASVAAGDRLFHANCATCHGERADGHGPAATGLDPPPADFRSGAVLAQHSDAYLYFRVSAGKPGTAMPSFHGVLDETERWQVIAYLRSLEGRVASGSAPP
jgi:mono/diheme cytochrome c family protein